MRIVKKEHVTKFRVLEKSAIPEVFNAFLNIFLFFLRIYKDK